MNRGGAVLGVWRREESRVNATFRFALWYLCLAATIALATSFSHRGAGSQFATLLMLTLCTGTLTLWSALDARFDQLPIVLIIVALAASRAIAFVATPLLEDDFFRYLWDGYITATTGQPYAQPPSFYFGDVRVASSMQSALSGINHPDVPTIYGGAWQVLFAASYLVAAGQLWPIKVVLLLVEIGILFTLSRHGVAHRWLLCWIAHPLLIQESAFSAHPDVLIGATLLAAALLWQSGRGRSAASVAAVAVAMKLSALIALPLFWLKQSGRVGVDLFVASMLTIVLLFVPVLLSASGSELAAIVTFGRQWTFNPLVFKVIAWIFGDPPARAIVLMLVAATAIIVALHWRRGLAKQVAVAHAKHYVNISQPILVILFALLLVSPAVNPWYWLWVLPLALWQRGKFALLCWIAATVSLLSYAHAMNAALVNASAFDFRVPLWATSAQLGCIAVAAACLFARSKQPLRQ